MRSCVCPAASSKQCSCRDCCGRVTRWHEGVEYEGGGDTPVEGFFSERRAVPMLLSRIKTWALALRRDAHAIYLASRDPRVPWYVKILAVAIAGYALSPIDLIP